MISPSPSLYNSEFGLVSAQENFLVTALLDQNSRNPDNPKLEKNSPKTWKFCFLPEKELHQ